MMWWDEIMHLTIWYAVLSIPDVGYRTEITKRYLIEQPVIHEWWRLKVFDEELPGPRTLDLKAGGGWACPEELPMHQFLKPRQVEMEFSDDATENTA